jgi:ATP-dependent Clp protease ATP-binding subunit ClpC
MHVQMNRFNNYARRVLALAHREAVSLGHTTIGHEHIFLGLVQDEGNVGKLLSEQGFRIDAIRPLIDNLTPSSKKLPNQARSIELGETAEKALEGAVEIARGYGQTIITPEHLLLAITRQENAFLQQVMPRSDLDLERTQQELERLLSSLRSPGEFDELLETLNLCRDLIREGVDPIHRDRLNRIEQIVTDYFGSV